MVFEIKNYKVVRYGCRTTEKQFNTVENCLNYIRLNMKKTYQTKVMVSYKIFRVYENEEMPPALLTEIFSFDGLDAYEKAEQEKARLEVEQIIKRLEAEQEKARLEAEQEKARLEVEQEKARPKKRLNIIRCRFGLQVII